MKIYIIYNCLNDIDEKYMLYRQKAEQYIQEKDDESPGLGIKEVYKIFEVEVE